MEAVDIADFMKVRIQDRVTKARQHFVGRVWLAEQLSSSLARLKPNRAILITGIGGTGKSFFFDRLLDNVTCIKLGGHWAELNRLMLGRQCCMFKYSDSLHPRKFVESLIGQLLRAIKDSGHTFTLDDGRKTPVDKFLYDHLKTPKHTEASVIAREVLVPALRAVGGAEALGGKCIILVDSLDEAQCREGNTIIPVLVDLMLMSPGWLRWVATSRPHPAVKAEIKPVIGGSIELSLHGKNQEADVREFVEKTLNLPTQREQAVVICKKAGGLFTYAVMAVGMLEDDPEMDVHSLPASVVDLFKDLYFGRKYKGKLRKYGKYPARMLATLVSARDALPLMMVRLACVIVDTPLSAEEVAEILEALEFACSLCHKHLLAMEEALMQFSHKTFIDFLLSQVEAGVFAVDVGLGHLLLATRCREVLKSRSELTDLCRQYSLRHVVHHLCYLHKHPYHLKDGPSVSNPLREAARVVLDFDWLIDRLLLDNDTQGVVEEMQQVSALLKARGGDGDVDLAKCVDKVQTMAKRARKAVRHHPRQIMGRIMHDLSGDTQPPVVNLVKRARQCNRFRWWYIQEGTLTMGGEGEDLTCVGDSAFSGECKGEDGSEGDGVDDLEGGNDEDLGGKRGDDNSFD